MTKLMNPQTSKSPFKERVAATAHILRLDWVLYAMLLPTLVYFVLFRVLPIINMRLAFFTYSRKTAWEWAGLKYFRQIFSTPQFFTILENTLIISFMKYVLLFPFFVIFAILLSEMRMQRCRKVVQVISYLPHFLSWVVIAGIWISLLSYSGAVSQIVQLFGGQPKNFMTDKGLIRWILMISEGWRSIGWDSIIYFTTIIS
ncbi:MAG TPA: sugar ABC transporter permease, partial [Candidatus Limiplasma pullistercoris]|nr:sugar ABC transporter permease [Candidatus Limiplasma pullistercoris]